MSTPVTSLDQQYSDPAAVAVGWDETLRVLEAAELFWITTVRADGRPHVTPLVAVWLDDALHFATGPHEQKAVNLRGNRHVILTTGRNDWQSGLDVVLEGDAVRVTDPDTLARLAQAWTTKWDGRWDYVVAAGGFANSEAAPDSGPDEAVLVFSVRPSRVLAFGKGSFSHTRHRF